VALCGASGGDIGNLHTPTPQIRFDFFGKMVTSAQLGDCERTDDGAFAGYSGDNLLQRTLLQGE